MLEHTRDSTGLVKVNRQDLAPAPEISKREIGVVTMWFGARDLVKDDLNTFKHELYCLKQFAHYAEFNFPDADKLKGEPYPALAEVDLDIRRELERTHSPLAIFIVTTAIIAERPWLNILPQGLNALCRQQRRDQTTFVYKIILGAGFSQKGLQDPAEHFSRNEMRAHELNGVYIPYTHDYRSLGITRTIEFMNRVLGHDLPGEKFPNYTEGEIRKIAWNINREDFNAVSPREGAISKYSIVDGKPQFPF